MSRIDTRVVFHRLSINPSARLLSQRKRKVGEEKKATIEEDVNKLTNICFIREQNIPTWLANVVMVKKASNKWRMCMDFTDLNMACLKDPYPMLDIDHVIDGSSGYHMLSFMDAYSRYNQIKMDPFDIPKTTFMSNHANYYYNVMPLGLKNVGTTYHRLMDAVFSHKMGSNLEVYIDDMIVNPVEGHSHALDLEDILQSVR